MLKLAKIQMPGVPSKRTALLFALALGTSLTALAPASANPMAQPPAPGGQQQEQPGQQPGQENNEVQQVLARYGQFLKHEKYGDVWKPTQVAQGWRPYEPCHWVYNQEMKAWYFDDKTEWGNIVHHYGRWTLDAQQGWLWVPGSDFSPGWVSWEMRGAEVGWAPLPPEQDAAIVQTAQFKNDPNLWIFVAFQSLGKGCGGSAPPPPAPRAFAPAMPAPLPAVQQAVVGGGAIVGGGYVGGYIPPRIIIRHGCHTHPRWCHWHPPHRPPHWNPPHGRPNDHHCRASWCKPHNHGNGPGGHRPGDHRPGGQAGNNGPKGPIQCIRAPCRLPGQHANNNHRPPHFNNPLWRNQFPRQQMAHRFTPNNRVVPRFNHQPRMNMAPRMAAPRMNVAPRSFAPRMSAAPRMGGGGGMRFAGGGGRRR